MLSKKHGKAMASAYENVMFPNIGTPQETASQLRATIEVQKKDLTEKDQKCGALQRNFESLSALCLKAEGEKSALEKAKN
jgi:hypothetical protein